MQVASLHKNSIISVSCGSHSCFCVVTLSLSPVTSPCLSGLPELCLHHCLFSLFVPSTLYSLFSITTYLDQLARASWTDQFSIAIKCHLMLVVIVTVMWWYATRTLQQRWMSRCRYTCWWVFGFLSDSGIKALFFGEGVVVNSLVCGFQKF